MITDNALIAFQCVYALQKGSKNAGNFCSYKLDLMKAYDRVDWDFLESAMRKLGFAKTWVDWIITCIKSAQLSVRFNGRLLKKFTPTRGLRQGDPISPYLFHFIAKGQSCLLYRQIELRNIQELMFVEGALESHTFSLRMVVCYS
jgi:hypothetical protein